MLKYKKIQEDNERLKRINLTLIEQKQKLTTVNEILETENTELKTKLDEEKSLKEQREKFCLVEHSENYNRKLKLDKIEEILTNNNYGSIENLINKILEVIRRPIKITSK